MPTGRISKKTVDAAATGFLWDQDLRGFGLKVTPKGARTYVFQYRMGGRDTPARRYTIGTHGSPWTPTTARDEAERLALMVRQGTDPRDDKLLRRREAIELAFSQYADRFLDRYVKSEWPASYDFAESILRLHVKPVLGTKPLPRIQRADITAVLDRLPAGKPALRRNAYAVMRRLFRWAVGRGDLDRSPLEGFEAPSPAASRDRVLSDEELRVIWKASDKVGPPFGPLFQLLLITGQRREEVAALQWKELDRQSATWILPRERAKNGKAHSVPLSTVAVELLDGIAGGSKWPRSGFIFTTTGTTPVSGHSRAKRRLDAAITEILSEQQNDLEVSMPAWRVHDLRRTLATGFQRLGIRFEVTEAVLNHVSGARSGVAGVYQRHDWASEKREALNAWAKKIARLTVALEGQKESNITPLRAHSLSAAP